MASPPEWIIPPTFSASNLLSARKMNIIEHDLGVLFGHNFAPPMMFDGIYSFTNETDPSDTKEFWRGRLNHQFDTLTARFATKPTVGGQTTCAWISISPSSTASPVSASDGIAGSPIASASNAGSTGTWAYGPSTIDLSSYPLNEGDTYRIRGYIRTSAGTTTELWVRMDYLFESAGSTGWTTPPTITSGCIVAASDLNTWRDDLDWLEARIGLDNHSFAIMESRQVFSSTTACRLAHGYIKHTGDITSWEWQQRVDPGEDGNIGPGDLGSSEISLIFNGSTLQTTTCDASQQWKTVTGSADLSGRGLNAGQLYEIYITGRNPTAGGGAAAVRLHHITQEQIIAPNSWSAPKTWHHGDAPDSGSGQKISDNLTELHATRRDIVWPARGEYLNTFDEGAWPEDTRFAGYSILHRMPWLHVLGRNATLVFGNNSQSIGDSSASGWYAVNLEEITWLPRGAIYRVESDDIVMAFESFESEVI